MRRIEITRPFVGLAWMQVCAEADATDEEILAVANTQNPSGTSHGWTVVIREGTGSPVACAEHPERLHLLISC